MMYGAGAWPCLGHKEVKTLMQPVIYAARLATNAFLEGKPVGKDVDILRALGLDGVERVAFRLRMGVFHTMASQDCPHMRAVLAQDKFFGQQLKQDLSMIASSKELAQYDTVAKQIAFVTFCTQK